MGIFTKQDEHGYKRPRVGVIASTAIGSLTAIFTAFGSMYINEERQSSLEVMFGQVVDRETTPGLKFKTPWLSSRYAYSLARQRTDVTEASNLRTGDDLRLSGRYHIEYEIDESADINKLYFDLQDQGGDLDNVVEVRAKDAAVRAIESLTIEDLMPEESVPKEEIQSFTAMITEGIQQRLTSQLQKEGWPVRIIGVYSDGFNFTKQSEDRIAEIVGIRAERVKLGLRLENAIKAQDVYAAEAGADAAYINALRTQAGLQEGDVAFALCLKMNRDAGRVNEPFAAGCAGGEGVGVSVAVDPAQVRTPEDTPAPAAPAPN